jgi:phosphoglycolate phosphatase-like HAD superfamily hydrolase
MKHTLDQTISPESVIPRLDRGIPVSHRDAAITSRHDTAGPGVLLPAGRQTVAPRTDGLLTRAVIFDFDGTIVDSMNAFADIAAEVMPRRLPVSAADARRLYLETSGLPFFQQLEALFPGDPANAATAEEFEQAKLEGYFREPLFDDAIETIGCLREQGIRTVVSSNNFQNLVNAFVWRGGIDFDLVLGFRPGFDKGTAHFRYVEQTYRLPPERCTFVGDSIKDGERAEAHGIAFIGKTGTFTREQFQARFPKARVIDHLSELTAMFTTPSTSPL